MEKRNIRVLYWLLPVLSPAKQKTHEVMAVLTASGLSIHGALHALGDDIFLTMMIVSPTGAFSIVESGQIWARRVVTNLLSFLHNF